MSDFYTLPSGSKVRLSEVAGAAELGDIKIYKPSTLGVTLPFAPSIRIDDTPLGPIAVVLVAGVVIFVNVWTAISQYRAIGREPSMFYKIPQFLGMIGSGLGITAIVLGTGLLGNKSLLDQPMGPNERQM